MRRDDCVDVFGRIPEVDHPQVNLVMRGQGLITVDVVVRFEPHYLVVRGREGGSTDEGRAFFVPYDEIAYLRVERVVKVGELRAMYGDTAPVVPKPADDPPTPPPTATPVPLDPAAIAKQNLLDRIRAARTSVGKV